MIRAGEAVTVSLVAANRDAHRFPDPDTLDIANPAAQGQLGFCFGIHQRTGQQLAHLEMQTALKELVPALPRPPARAAGAGHRDARHHVHLRRPPPAALPGRRAGVNRRCLNGRRR
ncbi:cytochrome P450 [Streptomyces achromogenes]|uniref:Cytochrome P450 n=1 Tax=Streptomyces achromogenes TaxID=67255 RepID=A0ABU0QFB0_STRAH|nr:hypothetical protein [Streptomyces achromogenes]MDQ0688871.1 cytochrome P450 [Streptomyces achromogenes]MDQ0836037.1 cytochrome P450 [Streptomyces achromogenes]